MFPLFVYDQINVDFVFLLPFFVFSDASAARADNKIENILHSLYGYF